MDESYENDKTNLLSSELGYQETRTYGHRMEMIELSNNSDDIDEHEFVSVVL